MIRTVEALEERLQHIKTPMSLSVLGCVVNGPGEARETDIGITGGGNGKHMVYLSGVTDHHVQDADMIDHIVRLVEAKAAEIEAAADARSDARRGRIGLAFLHLRGRISGAMGKLLLILILGGALAKGLAARQFRAAAADRLRAAAPLDAARLIAAKRGA